MNLYCVFLWTDEVARFLGRVYFQYSHAQAYADETNRNTRYTAEVITVMASDTPL